MLLHATCLPRLGIRAAPHLSFMKRCKVDISIPIVLMKKLREVVACSRPCNLEVAAPGFTTRSAQF